jgi:hypothetical protein
MVWTHGNEGEEEDWHNILVGESAHFEIREENWRTSDSVLNRMKIDSCKGRCTRGPIYTKQIAQRLLVD